MLLLNFFLSIIFVVYFDSGIKGIFLSQLTSGLVIFIILFFKFLFLVPFNFSFNILFESLKLSFPLFPKIFLGVFVTQFDKYMISLLSSIGGVGIYHVGKKVSEISFTFTTSLQNVIYPQVYKKMFSDEEDQRNSIGGYLSPYFYISIMGAMIISFFAQEFLTILTPKSYHQSIPIVIILCIYYSFGFISKITGIQLIYSKKTGFSSLLSLISILSHIVFNIFFISMFGVIGAAWATLIAGFLNTIIGFFIAQNFYKVEFEWGKIYSIFITFIIGSLLILILIINQVTYSYVLGCKLFFAIFLIIIGIKFRIITRNTLNEFKSIFHD